MRFHIGKVASCCLLGTAVLASSACRKKADVKSDVPAAAPDAAKDPTQDSTSVKSVDDAAVLDATATLALPGALNLFGTTSGSSLTDYEDDKGQFNTDDRALEALSTVSTIMCFMDKVNYTHEKIVNQGHVISTLDMNACEKSGGGGGGGGGGSGGSGKQRKMVNVVVDAKREEGKPLVVNLWFDEKDGRIAIRLVVAQGPSDLNPLGIFRFVYQQSAIGADGAVTPSGHGQMETKRDDDGQVVLTFIDDSSHSGEGQVEKSSQLVAVTLKVDADKKVVGGTASLSSSDSRSQGDQSQTSAADYKLAWDQALFVGHGTSTSSGKGGDDGSKAPGDFCKDQNKFNMSIWQYGVYDAATRNRIKMNGGFPLVGTVNGKTIRAFASYYGLSTDHGSSLPSGTTLTKENFGDKAATPAVFKTVSSLGKLTKHVRKALPLAALDGIALQGFDQDSRGNVRVEWSTAKSAFLLTGKMAQQNGPSNGPPEFTDVTPPTAYTLSPYGASFFSQGLGGRVDIILDTNKKPASAAIYADVDVTGTAANMTLYCFQNCLKSNLTAADVSAQTASVLPTPPAGQMPNPYAPWPLDTPQEYTFDKASLLLKNASGPIAMATGEKLSQGGMGSPMIQTLVDAATLAKMVAAKTDPSQASAQDVSYSWNVGDVNNPWTMYQGLVDANGTPVTFDAPIVITYTHKAENEASGANDLKAFGKTFHIQFDGSNLQIPGHQDKDSGFWVNDFAIKSGVASDDGAYLVKPLSGSRYMKSTDAAACAAAGLDPAKAPALPDPASFNAAFGNSDPMPDLNGLPTVMIDGVPAS